MAQPGAFKKGEKKPNQGKRGPGKINKALKDMILNALESAGGEEYLQKQANENPNAFMTLIGKVLPMQVTGGDNSDKPVEVVYRFVRPDNTDRD